MRHDLQVTLEVAEVALLAVPRGQSEQVTVLFVELKLPAGQAEHTVEPFVEL